MTFVRSLSLSLLLSIFLYLWNSEPPLRRFVSTLNHFTHFTRQKPVNPASFNFHPPKSKPTPSSGLQSHHNARKARYASIHAGARKQPASEPVPHLPAVVLYQKPALFAIFPSISISPRPAQLSPVNLSFI